MIKKYCPNLAKNLISFVILLLIFVLSTTAFVGNVFAATSGTINFQGKIVRNDTGYEGLNVVAGTPACVIAGSGNDTCDFQVKYYDASSGGNLLLTEDYLNVEIGEYNGAFNLSLGSDSTPTAGVYSTLEAAVMAEDDMYVELLFAPLGAASYTETFSRMSVQATAYALRSKYASEADSAFQFDSAADATGYSTPTAGMVYYDSDESVLKMYNGSSWNDITTGSGGSSLFTDGGDSTYLTSLTDHLLLGASSYTAIGTSTYDSYIDTNIASMPPFAFDMGAERLTLSGSQQRSGLSVYSNYASSSPWPLVSFKAEDSGFSNTILELIQDGTGDLLSFKKGSTEVLKVDNNGALYFHDYTSYSGTTDDRLYNVGGTLYWDGSALSTGGSSLWTDSGTQTYLTSLTDDVGIGTNNPVYKFQVATADNTVGIVHTNSTGVAKFFTQIVSNAGRLYLKDANGNNDVVLSTNGNSYFYGGNVGIGTTNPTSLLEVGGASSVISNASGDLTLMADDTVVIKANDTEADNLMEWQNSTGTVLSLMNQNGYATIGGSTSNTGAMLTLGANSASVAQLNLTSSAGIDVTAPTSGDLWWNGSNLYFYDGSDNIDLLTGNGGDLFSENGSVSNGSYLNVNHAGNTYEILADGWVCVGGSDNAACSGGNWKNISESSTTVGHYLANQWNDADSDGVVRSTINATDVQLTDTAGFDYGVYTSPAIPTPNAQTYGPIRWDEELDTYGDVAVQTRSGSADVRKYGIDFDGNNDYLQAASNYDFTSEDFTISMWIKPTGRDAMIFSNGLYHTGGYYAQIYANGSIVFSTHQSGAHQVTYTLAGSVTNGEWTFVSVVRSGSTVTIYLDGVDATNSHGTHIDPTTTTTNFYVGTYGPPSTVWSFAGGIDEVRVWDDVRTPTEILNNMNVALTGSESNLVGYWQLDEMTGSTANDLSSSSNDLTITNASWRKFYDWESWKPFETTTNYVNLETADTHTNWTGTNVTVAEGDVIRDVDFYDDENEMTVGNITKLTSSTNGGYAEATISSTDISNYDYVTAWVRASVTGATISLGFGETAGTEQTEVVTIDTASKWQKVYWDISDIADASKNGVTKLRLTNLTASSNTIYLDNIRAEKLSTDNEGSTITSTPDDYLQYRLIFTTTNDSYQPSVENVSFSYNSGYRIVIYDDDNVRLYNYTGELRNISN